MAASSMCRDESDQFMQWLEGRLLQLNADLDVSVFVMYICGILESYSGYDDKKESLLDIVGEIAEEDKDAVCDELIQKWDEMANTDSKKGEEAQTAIEERLSQMLSSTHVATTVPTEKKCKQLSEEEKARKQAILAQYSNVCDEPDLEVEPVEAVADAGGAAPTSSEALIAAAAASLPVPSSVAGLGLMHNANKDNVSKREKETRDKMKLENDKKKEKDKQDRETQKNKKQERKDTEKKRTQKGERRR